MKNKLARNTSSSLIMQITSIFAGFILPRLIIGSFGSDVNGLVTSISQFLQMITLLELGVGSVVQSTLYKPLAENNQNKISEIVTSANRFFKTISYYLLIYIFILIFFYPFFINSEFDQIFTATLIITMSISSFSQYLFGMVDKLLLISDQKGYILYNAQSITLITNALLTLLLIKYGASIQIIKLCTSFIYLIRPILIRLYIQNNYKIERNINYIEEPIKQKWNGIAQHIAALILDGTDVIVLSIMASLSDVSIYSIYYLVVNGIKQIVISLTYGIQAYLGELWAKQDFLNITKTFSWTEWLIHNSTIFIFGCTATLITPFVQIFTFGINDAIYYQPVFAILLTSAHAIHCLRLPYQLIIIVGGHYKQTQECHIIAALLNLIISILAVTRYGLIGVAIGTFISLFYQTLWMAFYISKNLIKWPFIKFLKQLSTDILVILSAFIMLKFLTFNINLSITMWIILAVKVSLIWLISIGVINFIFYKDNIVSIFRRIRII